MKPRLLILTPTASLFGGLASWLDYLEPGLAEAGWDPVIGLLEGPEHHRPGPYLAEHPHRNSVAVRCMSATPEGRYRALRKAIRDTRPDIVATANVPDAFPAIARMRLAAETPARAVMTQHGISSKSNADIAAHRGVLDAVICPNRLACRLAHTLGGMEEDRIFYAPCGTEVPAAPRHTEPAEPLQVACSATLVKHHKRIFDIPALAARLDARLDATGRDWRLRLAGDGPDRDALLDALRPHIDSGRIAYLGRLSHSEMEEKMYRGAHALLMPSSWETGPIVIWEAMARGVIVVSARYVGSGLEGTLHDGENALLFDVGDVEAAAGQLVRLLDEPGLAGRLADRAHARVSERYSIAASVAAWDRAFRAVLELPHRKDVSDFPPQPAPGRLDALVGPGAAESIRGLLRRKAPPGTVESEWPASHSRASVDDPEFWEHARREDGIPA